MLRREEDRRRVERRRGGVAHYVVSESLPLLLPEGLTEALDEPVQFLGMAAQELPDVVQALQAVRRRWAELRLARVHLHGPGDAQDVVALLLVIVEGFVEQDGDRRWSWEAKPQQDLPVLDPDLLQQSKTTFISLRFIVKVKLPKWDYQYNTIIQKKLISLLA